MLMAQLRGKLSIDVWQRKEDLLTSAVFGTLKYMPSSVLNRLLDKVQPLAGRKVPHLQAPLTWRFWPSWSICEPDVVIEDSESLCVFEAKLFSGFGQDSATGSQLRREWNDGFRLASAEGKTLWLVPITNHPTIPEQEIRQQLVHSEADLTRVGWLSWFEVGRLLQQLKNGSSTDWCEDLLELLSRMGLAPCNGFGSLIDSGLMEVVGGLSSLNVPWVNRVLLADERRHTPGFASLLSIAQEVGAFSVPKWRLIAAFGKVSGFAPALSEAQRWAERGGQQWGLKQL